MKIKCMFLGFVCCLCFSLFLAVIPVQAQTATAGQGQFQGQESINTIVGGTQVIGGSQSPEMPRSWYIPPYPAGAPNYPYAGFPYRWGKELVPDGLVGKFKKIYHVGELRKLAERPGGLIPQATIYQKYGFSPFVEFSTHIPANEESERRFRASYECIAEVSVEGALEKTEAKSSKNKENQMGDTAKIRGYVGVLACEIGGDFVLAIQQDGNFEHYGDSRYTSIGISFGSMSGGSGAAQAGTIGFSHTWGHSKMGYHTRPYTVYLIFKATGRKYVPYYPPPPKPLVQQRPVQQQAGEVQEVKGGNELPAKKPDPSILLQEKH